MTAVPDPPDVVVRRVLEQCETWAVVGLSTNRVAYDSVGKTCRAFSIAFGS